MATPHRASYTQTPENFDTTQEFITNVKKEIMKAPNGKDEGKDGLFVEIIKLHRKHFSKRLGTI